MPKPISFGKIDVSLTSDMEETKSAPEEETPFRIVILGDFTGRTNRGIFNPGLAGRKPIFVDKDNIDELPARLNVEINLSILGKDSAPITIKFAEMDDFHPDRLYEKLDAFEALHDMRQSMKDPETFASLIKEEIPPPSPVASSEKKEEAPELGSLLDVILDESEDRKIGDKPYPEQPEMQRFLKEITQPHLVPKIHPKQAEMIATVDEASGELMRRILHHPDFQAVESLWRGLYFLVSRLDTDEKLKIYLLDISKEELAADLSSAEELSKTGTYKILVEHTIKMFGGEPWAVIVGNYRFNQGINDIVLLGRMAKIAWAAGAPFISSASDTVLGCESVAKCPDPDEWKETEENRVWDALRKIPEASYLGLALPRFLLRLPYGRDTVPVESLPFQEMPEQPVHEQYLWGNSSFACTYLLAQSFIEEGWGFQQGQVMDIEGMPLHVYKEQGESVAKPCAEVVLTEEAAEKILDKGLLLLLSYRNQDVIRLARFQSLADPPANLSGRWG
ncbi:MAG: type VI secretion system contractile sheath large subunit [Syntrophaceae bacterium]